MLQINQQTESESELLTLAHLAGKSANEFVAILLERTRDGVCYRTGKIGEK